MIKGKDSLETTIINNTNYTRSFQNLITLKKEIDTVQQILLKAGFLDLELKNIEKTSDSSFQAKLELKKRYSEITIHYNSETTPVNIIENITDEYNNTEFNIPFTKIEETLQYLTNYIVNSGNTFSNVSLTEITKKETTVDATLLISKGNFRTLDKITIKGYTKFPTTYLKYYSRLKTGRPFNKNELIEKSNSINELRFANNIKPPEILFRKDSTLVFLYLKKETANSFDGFLGFSNDTETGDLELNGYLNLNLINNLNYGEKLNLIYKSDGNEQQRFTANISLPYLFKTPLGIEAGLDIFKRDSSFLNTEQNINLTYLINSKAKALIGYNTTTSSNLLDIPQPSLNLEDYNSKFIRTGFTYTKSQNNQLFPTKSNYSIITDIGSRKNNNDQTNQIKGIINLEHIINLNRRNSIFIKNTASAIFSDNLFTNELYRFGGINSIRGFEENTLNASLVNTLNTEYRYLLSSNLFVHSIIDFGYFEDEANDISNNLTSFGFGLGLSTQTGIFRIIFANGKTNNQNFEFSNTKVHLSLNARF